MLGKSGAILGSPFITFSHSMLRSHMSPRGISPKRKLWLPLCTALLTLNVFFPTWTNSLTPTCVIQFSLILTLSSWSWCQTSQVKGSLPQGCSSFRCQLQVQTSHTPDRSALNWGFSCAPDGPVGMWGRERDCMNRSPTKYPVPLR